MNLADAIRQASNTSHVRSAETFEAPETFAEQPLTTGTVVKLELFLNPEQLSNLFRTVTAGQHSMMTSREAAAYLRISPSVLEGMALEGAVPAINLDGRWRFPKPALDEWLSSQAYRKGAA